MATRPEVRYFIPCWKEPTRTGNGPSAHEIMYTIQPKKGHTYPLWQRPFFILAMITNLHGRCPFHIELRLEELAQETTIQATDDWILEVGNDPLRVQPISIMMKAVELEQASVYHLYFVWKGEDLARAIIIARGAQ